MESLGGYSSGTMFPVYNQMVSQRLGVSSPLVMDSVWRMQSATAGTLYVDIKVTDTITTTGNKVHFIVVEEGLSTYGITPGIARDMLTDETFTLTAPGESLDLVRHFTLSPSWNLNNIGFAVLVQSHATPKTILQACRAERGTGIEVTPEDGLYATGDPGGPFSPTGITYTVTNVGRTSLNYTATADAPWLTVTNASGTLGGGDSVEVSVELNEIAPLLGAGIYRETVTFTDLTRHLGDCTRDVTLEVGERELVYDYPLDTDPVWTRQGNWRFGTPAGLGGQNGEPDPTSGHTGTNVYGYNLNGDYEYNMPERSLTTTAIDMSEISGATLKFWRWLGVEQPANDHAYVRVSTDGTTWTAIWSNPTEMLGGAWVQEEFDIATIADYQPTLYLRWVMGSTNASQQYCGWNIDDIEIWGILSTESGVADASSGSKLILHPNSPNPFAGTTTIAYETPSRASVRLAVYDVAGRLVRVLVDEERNAGTHAAHWDGMDAAGRRAASGVYFARIEAAGASARERIVLLR